MLNTRQKISLNEEISTPVTEETTMLGVKLNGKLDWNSHITYVKKKSCQCFHALHSLKLFLPPRELHSVYTGHIRSVID